jgi:hypothetical protein
LTQLSKYVADYARHSFAGSVAATIPRAVTLGLRSDCTRNIDGRSYCGVDLRARRPIGALELFVEAANVFDVRYQEIKGVDMAPRWLAAGVRVGRTR